MLTVNSGAATTLGTPAASSNCQVTLKWGTNANFATINVAASIVNATTLAAQTSTLTFANWVRHSGGTLPAAVKTNVSDTSSASSSYTFTIASLAATPWLSCLTKAGTTTGTVSGTVTDTVTCSVVSTGTADAPNAGVQTAAVHLQVPNQADVILNVSLTTTSTTSPLTSNVSPIVLTYLIGGGNSQASATVTPDITSTDVNWDAYTILQPGNWPAWLTATAATGQAKSGAGNKDTATFKVSTTFAPTAAASYSYLVHLNINASAADLLIPVTLNVIGQSMTSTPASISLKFIRGGTGVKTTTANNQVLAGGAAARFTLDASTVPPWLTVSPATSTSTTNAVLVTYTLVDTVVAGMALGNFTANVGFINSAYPAGDHLIVPVALSIANTNASLSFKEGADAAILPLNFAKGAPDPQPTFTPYSSNEPVPFTAACTVTTSEIGYTIIPGSTAGDTCVLNSTSGVAYTLGYGITATLAHDLFAGALATYGNTVDVKVVVTPQTGSQITLTYRYTLRPTAPVIATSNGISPTSVAVPTAATSGNSTTVVLVGNYFVAPGDIYNNGIVETQVYLGGSHTALTADKYVVLNSNQMMITIPNGMLPTITAPATSAQLQIGLANQTDTNQPSGQTTLARYLTVTQAPVIYAITSTASYVQPALGSNSKVSAYELISIFGDQFLGMPPTTVSSATAGVGSNPLVANKVPAALVIGGTVASPTNLTVTFKDAGGKNPITAPLLFANQNQINAIVPSSVVVGTTWNVTVTSGKASSDLFYVDVKAADPGIFTLASSGVGQAAIINLTDYSVNGSGHAASAGQGVSIYMTGLGAPSSIGPDSSSSTGQFPGGCVAASNTVAKNGYLQMANAPPAAAIAKGITAPKPVWTNIDGAIILADLLVSPALPPCIADPVTVTFGSGPGAVQASTTTNPALVGWAGFGSGSIAGLYQINVTIPPNAGTGDVPIQVSITPNGSGTVTSPANGPTIRLQ